MEPVYKDCEFESVREIRDDAIGLNAYLVIGTRINDLTCGGLRIHEGVSVQELKDLAKVMELKQSFLGLPRGGSRAGIIAPYGSDIATKQALMNRFAELVVEELVGRRWLVAIDIGTNIDLVHRMYQHVGVSIPKPSKEIANAGYFTALGVLKSIEYCLEIKSRRLKDCTFAIEGMGNVGASLMRLLIENGAKVIAVSNIDGAIANSDGLTLDEALSFANGDENFSDSTTAITKEELLELPIDVLCPCATDSTIHSGNAAKLQAAIVCAGANNPVTRPAMLELYRRDILYLPDFITNSGGALGNMVKFAGLNDADLRNILDNEFVSELKHVYSLSVERSLPPAEIAFDLLNSKFESMKNALEQSSNKNMFREFALSVYRSGLVPKALVKPVALKKIKNSIGVLKF